MIIIRERFLTFIKPQSHLFNDPLNSDELVTLSTIALKVKVRCRVYAKCSIQIPFTIIYLYNCMHFLA